MGLAQHLLLMNHNGIGCQQHLVFSNRGAEGTCFEQSQRLRHLRGRERSRNMFVYVYIDEGKGNPQLGQQLAAAGGFRSQ